VIDVATEEPRVRIAVSPLSEPERARDKLFITLFFLGILSGLWLSLQSAGYILAFNVNTLLITTVIFGICSANYWWRRPLVSLDTQIAYSALCLAPIGLRALLQLPIFTGGWNAALTAPDASVSPLQQLGYMLQVVGLWILVAVSEECFRASMMNFADLFAEFKQRDISLTWKALFSNTVWIAFHFAQRGGLTPQNLWLYRYYIIWLFVSGLVMTYALVKAGLGASCLIHLLVNLSA